MSNVEARLSKLEQNNKELNDKVILLEQKILIKSDKNDKETMLSVPKTNSPNSSPIMRPEESKEEVERLMRKRQMGKSLKKTKRNDQDQGIGLKSGAKIILESWDKNTGGKIGTISGAGVGVAGGGLLGVIVGTSTLGATIGTMIFPAGGTIIGSIIGATIGMTVAGFGGAVIGGQVGSKMDPHESFVDKSELERDASKLVGSMKSISTGGITGVFTGVKGVVSFIFQRYSKGNDEIPLSKLKLMFQDLGWFMEDDELEACKSELDTNHDGILQFDEFYKWYESSDKFVKVASAIRTAKSIAETFRQYDTDHSGTLDHEEFTKFYYDFVQKQGYKDPFPVDEVLKTLDLDKRGHVRYNEFVNFEMDFFRKKYDLTSDGQLRNPPIGIVLTEKNV